MTFISTLRLPLLITAFTVCSCFYNSNKPLGAATISLIDNKQQAEVKTHANIGGTYSFGDDVEKGPVGSIIIYPLTDSSALFVLDVCRGAPSYNLGELFGQMFIKNNIGIYNSKNYDRDLNCLLKFEFKSTQIKVTTSDTHDDCGFGYGVYADHTYKLTDKSVPKYFINGEGDTIQFRGLTVEKYAQRFN